MLNDFLNKSKKQKHITAFENKVIRNKLKNVAGGTDFQMREAVKYIDKVINNAEFRATESAKYKNIDKITKEIKGFKDKSSKYTRVKEIFNIEETADVLEEYKDLTKENLEGKSAEEVEAILSEVQSTKADIKEKAAKRIEEKRAKKAG